MRRGEIWSVDLSPVAGREQSGRWPVLIVSGNDFNRASGTVLVCPITGGGVAARASGFTISLATVGTQTTGVILLHQLRTLDLRARNGQKIESVPDEIIEECLARLAAFFG